MSKLDDLKSSFEHDLDEQIKQHEKQLEIELASWRTDLLRSVEPVQTEEIPHNVEGFGTKIPDKPIDTRQVEQHARVVQDKSLSLNEIDTAFIEAFNLGNYYPTYRLDYPTVYCETMEEFFTPIVNRLNLSPQARQASLDRRIEEAQEKAEETGGGGILGYNLPGDGCYLNGWLFTYRHNLSPDEERNDTDLSRSIIETTVHEKLGHGFLQEYSTLGSVKRSLGLIMTDLARKFGIRQADDPISSLRGEQASLLFFVTQLLEEGWATWLESFLPCKLFEIKQAPVYSWNNVIKAVEELTSLYASKKEEQGAIFSGLFTLFGEGEKSIYQLHEAVMVIELIGSEFDGYFGHVLGQPLRYVVGEMLFRLAAHNLGATCLPYVALIAANVTLEPSQMSFSDLRVLLGKDPRLHPDARMAALSRLELTKPGDVVELARRAEQELSFSVPSELRQ